MFSKSWAAQTTRGIGLGGLLTGHSSCVGYPIFRSVAVLKEKRIGPIDGLQPIVGERYQKPGGQRYIDFLRRYTKRDVLPIFYIELSSKL